jgi:hypothetical protein
MRMRDVALFWTLMILGNSLAGCDPVRSVAGRVKSAAETSGTRVVAASKPLPAAGIFEVCGSERRILAATAADGSFGHAQVGHFDPSCDLSFESGDGSHEPERLNIGAQCAQQTGNRACQRLEQLEVTLRQTRPPASPVRISFTSSPSGLKLNEAGPAPKGCAAPCVATLSRGYHFLTVQDEGGRPVWSHPVRVERDVDVNARLERPAVRQQVGNFMLVPAVAGVILAPIALAREKPELLATAGGLLIGGTVGFWIIWAPDKVDVRASPAVPQPETSHHD